LQESATAAVAIAVHGVLARPQQVLQDGDRIELLRPLLADPKDNRRRRARGGD
jgi:putative ubiquitin-RnfH superfamily antitoxin RatB of RatAB toxin-antitoxin module